MTNAATATTAQLFLLEQLTDDGLMVKVRRSATVADSQVSQLRAEWRELMRTNPAESSDRFRTTAI